MKIKYINISESTHSMLLKSMLSNINYSRLQGLTNSRGLSNPWLGSVYLNKAAKQELLYLDLKYYRTIFSSTYLPYFIDTLKYRLNSLYDTPVSRLTPMRYEVIIKRIELLKSTLFNLEMELGNVS